MIFSKKVREIYSGRMLSRLDPDGTTFYFSADDFPGLISEPIAFKNKDGDLLSGFIYSYSDPIPGRLIIFDHGMGVGHRAYMTEIEKLCRHGYKVFSYDHTGCGSSEGNGIKGFAGSLSDLDYAVRAIRSSDEYSKTVISVMGHSWGGFSTMNICALHPDIESVVAMSGFINVKTIQKDKIRGILALWRPDVYAIERETNPDYYAYSSLDSLKNSKVRALIIHSEDDSIVSYKNNFLPLKAAFDGDPRITLLSLRGKDHSPNYTDAAVRYKSEFFSARSAKMKSGELSTDGQKAAFVSSFDWRKMTEQDENVWQKIFEHLDGANS